MGEYEKISYNNMYNAEKYDRITIMAQKGTKEKFPASDETLFRMKHTAPLMSCTSRAVYHSFAGTMESV